ncbi:MAG: chorismate mutase [Colwellia sp.]|nr:chorismate mutase [Colwellia sp.]
MKNIFIVCLLSIFSLQAKAEVISAELFRTINERLSYMEDVTLFKAKNHLPIENIQRENVVIDKAKGFASEQGFDPEIVKNFFHAQISVAKAIQYRYRADLLSQPSFRQPRDLQKDVRPALIRLDHQIIQEMAAYCKNNGEFQQTQFAEFNETITVKYVTETDKQLLFKALLKVKQ